MACHRVVADGIVVSVRLTPKAARDSIDGVGTLSDGGDVLMARVRAIPSEGAANQALVALIAKALKVARSEVTIIGGVGARLKRVHVAGDPAVLAAKAETWPRPS